VTTKRKKKGIVVWAKSRGPGNASGRYTWLVDIFQTSMDARRDKYPWFGLTDRHFSPRLKPAEVRKVRIIVEDV